MKSWEDLWWLFTQPLFIGLLLFGVLLEPLLKYLHRFYPASWQEELKKAEALENEQLIKRGRQYTGKIVFLPPLVVYIVYLMYTYLHGGTLSPFFVSDSIARIFAPAMMVSFSILSLNDEFIFKYLFQEKYPLYRELSQKLYGADKYTRFIDKHKKILAWFFIFLGLLVFLSLGGYLGEIDVQ